MLEGGDPSLRSGRGGSRVQHGGPADGEHVALAKSGGARRANEIVGVLTRANDSSGRAAWPERDREVPNRSVPFPFGAFAGGIPAGYVSLYQRSPQNIGNRWQLFGQALSPLRVRPIGTRIQRVDAV